MPTIDFWYEFASTYSYLSAMRIEALAAERGIAIRWRPLLLGPIFAAQGWNTSPFNLYPAKGRYMWRDMARITRHRGLALVAPDPFPQNGLRAARIATIGALEGWGPAFSRAVFLAEFAEGRDISGREILRDLLDGIGVDGEAVVERADGDLAVKEALRSAIEEARGHGVFGAPSFVTADGELFWGDDRLEDAMDWAAGGGWA